MDLPARLQNGKNRYNCALLANDTTDVGC